jgi:molybdate transport system permease protein
MYRTTLGAFEQVNRNYLDAARTLGASERIVFRRVLLPLAAPGVLAGTVLAFARSLGEFGATLMLAGNIPGRTETMPIAIFSAAEGGDMRAAYLWVSLIVLLSLAMIRLLNRQSKNRRPKTKNSPSTFLSNPTHPAVHPWLDSSTSTTNLDITIEKKLEHFDLDVSFNASRGAVGLLGASGAGKSMTLRMIAGIVQPDSGRIVLNGRVLFDSSAHVNVAPANRKIGVVFQDYALFPMMTVAENIGFGLSALPANERRIRVQTQLERMRIDELADRYPSEISGGQRQRVAIARCMAIEPDALLFDEPFAALDPHLRRQMEEQLRETLADFSGAVVFVTHDMEEAFRFCSDLLVLDRGRVIASGPKHQLFERPRSVAAARLTGCKNIVSARKIADHRIAVDAWSYELETALPVPDLLTHVGLRSHQITFQPAEQGDNVFQCWLVGTSEAPHEMTLYLRLREASATGKPPHLQVDIPKDIWRALSTHPQPWLVKLDSARLLLLEG